jgi:tetratricopeptide (TPR) repeat protein
MKRGTLTISILLSMAACSTWSVKAVEYAKQNKFKEAYAECEDGVASFRRSMPESLYIAYACHCDVAQTRPIQDDPELVARTKMCRLPYDAAPPDKKPFYALKYGDELHAAGIEYRRRNKLLMAMEVQKRAIDALNESDPSKWKKGPATLAAAKKELLECYTEHKERTLGQCKTPQFEDVELPEDIRRELVAAEALAKSKKYDEASLRYEKLLQKYPGVAVGYFNWALVAGTDGFVGDASALMHCYVRLAPKGAKTREAQDKIYEWEAQLGVEVK